MSDSPDTRPSLLARIRNARDSVAWGQFTEIYTPLIYGYARKCGLQEEDAADVTQEVLSSIARAVGKLEYDPQRGSFRGWLFTVVRNQLRNFLASQRRRTRGTGDPAVHQLLEQQAGKEPQDPLWDQEYERRLFAWAAAQVRDSVEGRTWQAFWRTAVEGQSPKAVASQLAMTVANVRLAKSRVMVRLKEQIQRLEGGGPARTEGKT